MIRTNELVALRKRKKKTQADCAEALNMSTNSYQRKEIGISEFTTDEVVMLCDFLEVKNPNYAAYIFLPSLSLNWDTESVEQ